MSIIFQLFNAEDLQKLSYDELEGLRKEIIKALAPDPNNPPNEIEPLKLNLAPKTGFDDNSPLNSQQWAQEALLKRFYEISHQLKTPPANPSHKPFNFKDLIRRRNDLDTQKKENLILEWAISCEVNHMEFYHSLLRAREAAYKFFEDKIRPRTARFKITGQSLEMLKAENISEDVLESLKRIINEEVTGEKEFLELLKKTIGQQTHNDQALILKHAAMTTQVRKKEPDSLYSPFNPRHPLSELFYDPPKPTPDSAGGPTAYDS